MPAVHFGLHVLQCTLGHFHLSVLWLYFLLFFIIEEGGAFIGGSVSLLANQKRLAAVEYSAGCVN